MENILEEDNDVTLDEVKQFLQQHNQEEAPVEQDKQEDEPRVNVTPSKLYDDTDRPNYYEDMSVSVRDDQHPITDSDKETYLQAALTDSQLELPIVMANGITVVCRDLNMYERDLSMDLVRDQIKDQQLPPYMVAYVMRNIRMPMQIVRINDKPFDTIKFDYKQYSKKQFETDKKELDKRQKDLVMPMKVFTQSLYLKALNIFEHKLARLEEASFNKDFWNPADHA